MKIRCGEIIQALLIAMITFLPIVATATIAKEHADSIWNLLAYVGLSAILCVAVMRLRMLRWFLLPLVLGGLAYSCYVWVVGYDFGYHAISAVYETNTREAIEFMKSPLAINGFIMFAILTVVLGCVIIRRWRWSWAGRRVRISRGVLTSILVVAAMSLTSWRVMGNEFTDMYPVRFFRQMFDYLEDVRVVRSEYAKLKYEYKGPPVRTEPLTVVLVMGESARAASWSLYGYGRETNPLLRAWIERYPTNTLLYRLALPAGCVTRVSVPSMLSVSGAKDFAEFYKWPSIFRVFNTAGLPTYVASAQPATGYYESLANMMLEDAAVSRRVRDESWLPKDNGLFPFLDEFLNEDGSVRLIVLHLQGSHLDYTDRYPEQYDRFSGDERVDAYDNSILYTDWILTEVLQRVRDRSEPALLIYTSDHGENLDDIGDHNLSHGAKATTIYEVTIPMVMYFNDAFNRTMPDVAQRLRDTSSAIGHHDMISQTILGVTGLTDKSIYRETMDLSSPAFTGRPLYYADNPRNIKLYSDVPPIAPLLTPPPTR